MDGEGGCSFVCALPLVSKSKNAKEVLCALRGPLSASKSENAAKVCAFDASSSRAVAVLLAVWLYQPACVRAVLLTVWLAPALCLLMRITALHPAVSLPLPPMQGINSLQQWSAQLPRPLASTSLAARCPHMHRLEVHRPIRVRRGCRCPRMHRLKVHRPFRKAQKCFGLSNCCLNPPGRLRSD